MVLTHYIRNSRPGNGRLESVLESLLVDQTPLDRLVTLRELEERFRHACRKHGETFPGKKGMLSFLENAVRQGFILEFHGTKLCRLLDLW